MVNIGETRFRAIPGVRIKRLRAGKKKKKVKRMRKLEDESRQANI